MGKIRHPADKVGEKMVQGKARMKQKTPVNRVVDKSGELWSRPSFRNTQKDPDKEGYLKKKTGAVWTKVCQIQGVWMCHVSHEGLGCLSTAMHQQQNQF